MQKEYGIEDVFIRAKTESRKIVLTYLRSHDNLIVKKLCIPLRHIDPISEYGPDYFYFWDEQANVGERIFGLPPSDIKHIEMTNEVYNPDDYI